MSLIYSKIGKTINVGVKLRKNHLCNFNKEMFSSGQVAQLSLKRKHLLSLNSHSRSQSTPEVNFNGDYERSGQLSIQRRRSGISTNQKRQPRLSLPPPPNEPYKPKRPHSMDIQSQRAQSLGNLTGR